MPSYGAGGAATVAVTVRVCVGTGVVIAAVVGTTGGGDAGAGLDVAGRRGGVVEATVIEVVVVGVLPDGMSTLPPRVAYTPRAVAATTSIPTADARIGTARDFRWGGGVVAELSRRRVGASGSTAPRLGDVAATRVGAEAG